jgi:hypothetical protein
MQHVTHLQTAFAAFRALAILTSVSIAACATGGVDDGHAGNAPAGGGPDSATPTEAAVDAGPTDTGRAIDLDPPSDSAVATDAGSDGGSETAADAIDPSPSDFAGR